MKFFLFFLLFFLTQLACCASSRADSLNNPFVCTTSLAAMNSSYPCEANLRALERARKPGIQVLYGTFGYDTSCLYSFAIRFQSRQSFVSIAFSNEARRRQNLLGEREMYRHDSVRGYNARLERMDSVTEATIVRRLREISEILLELERLGVTERSVTSGLEDNYTCKAWMKLDAIMRRELPPGTKIVRNPLKPSATECASDVDHFELHEKDPGMWGDDVVSTDGLVYSERQHKEWALKAKRQWVNAICFWKPAWQGVNPKKFVSIEKRVFKFPESDIEEIQRLTSIQ